MNKKIKKRIKRKRIELKGKMRKKFVKDEEMIEKMEK
jgi:hypothetical protein